MTISTTASAIIVSGTGLQSTFQFPFVADSAADITVTSISSNGIQSILSPSQYTLLINPPNPNQLWGNGGSITYPLVGPPISAGISLLIQRTVPLTQEISVQNQGNYYAQVTEQALDTLCMEIQQVAARTGQIRGIWASGIIYNFGDIVQDGINGNNSGNYYICAIANTSGTWTADLASGDWSLVIQSIMPTASLPLSVINGGTGTTTSTGTGSVVLSATPTFTGTVNGANIALSGTDTAASFNPTGASIPTNGIYLPNSNQVGISSNSALGFSIGYYTGSSSPVNSLEVLNCGTGFFPTLQAIGSDTNISQIYCTKGTGGHMFNTNGPQTATPANQFNITHTANAVNYLNVTGSATGLGTTTMQASGSDTDIFIQLIGKGAGGINCCTGGIASNIQTNILHTPNAVDYLQMTGGILGSNKVTLTSSGSDASIDIYLNPKAGSVRFNTIANGSVASVLTATSAPSGAHTAIQEWLVIKNAAGVARYIPCW